MRRTDDYAHKLHPWLRVAANSSQVVNAIRSDGSARMASDISLETKGVPIAPIHAELAQQVTLEPRWTAGIESVSGLLPKRPKIIEAPQPTEAYVNVVIDFFPEQQDAGDQRPAGMERVAAEIHQLQTSAITVATGTLTRRNMLCATVPVTALERLQRDPAVAFIQPSEPLALDHPQPAEAPAPKRPPSKAIGSAQKNGRGEGVLIGIIDVGGFDFAHPDFLDENGQTRFVAIWDQGGDFRPPPAGFSRGSEFRRKHLNAAIKDAKKPGLPPATWIEQQSQMQPGSHGTHVASIVAGNSGVCPKAKIAAVLLDVPAPKDDLERRRSTFSDTSSIIHAVEYLLAIAKEEDLPLSINISLGTNGGSHDGAGGVSRWLDAYLAQPGRAICVAAGNAGQEKAEGEGDLGWIVGRIHTSGRVPARGLEVDIEWTVVGDGIEDWSENELEIWYSAQDRFTVSLKPPGATEWIEVQPRQGVENRPLRDGVNVSIYNELYHPITGGNYISVYLIPNLDRKNFRGITCGVWKVRLTGDEVRDGRFDAWIERDDPREIGRDGGRRMFWFPSFFSERSNVDSHSITSLACGQRVIAVANLDEARERINVSSSQGPTRDGRYKPEVAAPGTNIFAANGFADETTPWTGMTGTSMASPYVAGVVGLMLAANKDLTAAQCVGILQRTASPLPGASYAWVNDMGFGAIDPEPAIHEAALINQRIEI
ncbi:S8 family serine peptidase [Mycobacterium sp. CVI_P3]|uniref:S8 family serine peptidase n=1 Tax=Mycobacterium pinniadriaticum TaxID=2994102 RepID=A0ABT3SJV4_9MYCO|nr:S8 family serine peptidase [Mycobacterium pinniadriaticum]MCX2933390.1 S8 family serine peptidase [Mycobacterium pinniadriaticum]MCX2939812.1 S8 family serine peptidase [Mycobacterium pinniadriaticum]